MKSLVFMTMAAATLFLTGCGKDDDSVNNSPVELRLTSGIEVQQTRAAFTPTQSTSITAGEVVSVWVDDAGTTSPTPLYEANQLKATAENTFTEGTPMYFPQTGNKVNIYAIHGNFTTPFEADDAFPTAAVEYSVAADQSAGGTAYTNSDLLYAYEKEVARGGNPTTKQLTFYHILSKLELAIVVGKGGPTLADEDAVTLGGVTLNGNFTPSTTAIMGTQSERADMLSDASTTSTGDMTLGQTTCEDFTDNVIYNEAILVPQDMKDKVLTFKLANGGTLTYTIPAFAGKGDATFESGKKYIYHITLNLTGLEVTSTIADWEKVGAVSGEAGM